MKKIYAIAHLLLLLFTACLLNGCDNEDDDPIVKPHVYGPLTARDNVIVIDSTSQNLDTTPSLLAAGSYHFVGTTGPLNATVGSVIVGEQGEGFLRRVIAASSNGNETILQTQQASFDELFSDGLLTINSSSDSLIEGKTSATGINYSITNHQIIQSGGLSLALTSASLNLNSNLSVKTGFSPEGLIEAEVATRNATLNGVIQLNITASQAVTLTDQVSKLKQYRKYLTIYVPVVILGVPVRIPIKIRINWALELHYGANISEAITRNVTFSTNNTLDLGIVYANNQWQGIYKLTPKNTFSLGTRTGNANANVKMALVPKMTVLFYGAAGPFVSVGLQEEINGAVAIPSLDWNIQFDAWLQSIVGVTGQILGKKVPDYNYTWNTDKLTYKSPDHLERTSGDNQNGLGNVALPNPIKVRILDSDGDPQSNVPVYFNPGPGNGSASPASTLTDADGYAQTSWTIANAPGVMQNLSVRAKKADGSLVGNSPIDFAAVNTAQTTCLPTAQMQLLTNGSSKTWRLIRMDSYTPSGTLQYSNFIATGTTINYTFNINGMLTYDEYDWYDVDETIFGPYSPNHTITQAFCSPSGNGNFHFGTSNNHTFTIDQLTLNSFIVRATNIHSNSYSIMTYVSP
jgi:hypothetical protein